MVKKGDGKKRIRIMDTTLRDAHQSLLATRMRTEDMLPIAEKIDQVGFWSVEAWGGATFDSCLRFLKEDPWERLRQLRKVFKKTKIQMLLRGQNILGYRHYSDDVLEKFTEKSVENGVDIFRIFDALNDLRNMENSIKFVKRLGAHAEGAVSYTISPVHSHDDFIKMAVALQDMGCDSICVKDMAGLLAPMAAYDLISGLKAKIKVPLHLHTHDTSGFGSMTYLKAAEAGIDIVDAAISPLASGTSQPAIEPLVASFAGTEYDTGLDMSVLSEIASYFRKVRKKYKKFDSEFNGINTDILISQIPGGMISNLASQLKEQGALDKMNEVLEEVPRVRQDFGYPPLVTPTSQMVGTQATLNILTGERYKVITSETKNYLKGMYGRANAPINEEVRKKAIGNDEIIECRPADLLPPEMDKLQEELGNLGRSVEDVLSYALFPRVALDFFNERESGKFNPESLTDGVAIAPAEGGSAAVAQQNLAPSEFNITVHGETYHIKIAGSGHKGGGGRPFFININGMLEEVMVDPLVEVVPSAGLLIEGKTSIHSVRPKATKHGDITTTMPGQVVKVKVKVGDIVSAGDPVCIITAMKMESELHTPVGGTVKNIYVKEGDQVNPDETLVEVE